MAARDFAEGQNFAFDSVGEGEGSALVDQGSEVLHAAGTFEFHQDDVGVGLVGLSVLAQADVEGQMGGLEDFGQLFAHFDESAGRVSLLNVQQDGEVQRESGHGGEAGQQHVNTHGHLKLRDYFYRPHNRRAAWGHYMAFLYFCVIFLKRLH